MPLTCLLHTYIQYIHSTSDPARTLPIHARTTVVSVSSYHHTNIPSPTALGARSLALSRQSLLEASRLATAAHCCAALINSIIALFNCTALFSGTIPRDDSERPRRLRQSSTSLAPRATLCQELTGQASQRRADRLSQSRSHLSPPITAHHTDTPVYPYLSRLPQTTLLHSQVSPC